MALATQGAKRLVAPPPPAQASSARRGLQAVGTARASAGAGGSQHGDGAAALGTAALVTSALHRRSAGHRRARALGSVATERPQEAVKEAAEELSPVLKVKNRPPKVTMSRRTPLGELPTLSALDACLAAGKLEEADQVTRDLILALADPDALVRGFALPAEVRAIAAADLRAIDACWLRHSGGRLGYSVQRRLWQEGQRDWQAFMRKVDWLVPDKEDGRATLRYWPRRQFHYAMDAPEGHLPLTNMIRGRDLLRSLLEHPAFDSASPASSSTASVASDDLGAAARSWWGEITGKVDEDGAEAAEAALASTSAFDGKVPELSTPVEVKRPAERQSGKGSEDAGEEDWLQQGVAWLQGAFGGQQDQEEQPERPAKAPLPTDASQGLEFDFRGPGEPRFRVLLIAGFETFNARQLAEAAQRAVAPCEGMQVCLFTDKDIETRRDLVLAALKETDVFFCSLLFDFDQAEWLQEQTKHIPVRFVFESAIELIQTTTVGSFTMKGGGGKGAPPAVRSMISMITGQREEDRIAGYTKFLKAGPKMLKFLPQVGPLPDLRRWLQTYAYWSGGGSGNVAKMFRYLGREFGGMDASFDDLLGEFESSSKTKGEDPEVVEIPQVGLLHPSRKYATGPGPFFETPKQYLEWYRTYRPEAFEEEWPVCAILLYRKHVISELPYIPQLVNFLEEQHKILPLPIFIQGVDAHIAVRDLLTSREERAAVAEGRRARNPTLSEGAVDVDCVVNTIGFPLVGGPAGSMEGGRNIEIAKEILSSMNVPYIVAAPLLIQDVSSWREQGIGGLQGIVLYALPELDGAIDTVPLGGLLKNSGEIEMLPDRVDRLASRIRGWVELRKRPKSERRVAIVLYGYPPGLGAAGTAALLNVPRSLQQLLKAMQEQGYDVGDLPDDPELLIKAVRDGDAKADSGQAYKDAMEIDLGASAVAVDQLGSWLPRKSQEDIEAKWGSGLRGSGIRTMGDQLLLGGRRYGNVWLAVQPPLGIPGDPMRLLFERDMTPHPQYVAFYKYLQNDFKADAVVHFGMHGTVEWLPGRPLGNMGTCWPDQLLGGMPNVYLYAANNPSESVLAKRRGYGCLISHNVPPYAKAGLYRELQTLRPLLSELVERGAGDVDGAVAASAASSAGAPASAAAAAAKVGAGKGEDGGLSLEGTILEAVFAAGLEQDCPLPESVASLAKDEDEEVRARQVSEALMSDDAFMDYASKLRKYLAELEASLFSSGLHSLGKAPDEEGLRSYLSALFDGTSRPELPEQCMHLLCTGADHQAVAGAAGQLDRSSVEEAVQVRDLLLENGEELQSLMRALNGEYILPAPGGDLLRDGPGVLPTGRNIHALDPYRVPSGRAMARGLAAAEATIAQQLSETGSYPETVAVNLWGLEAIKTRGESVGVVLGLIGARPVEEATGRVVRYELLPLEELGRPRIDALCSLSGIFRDTFSNVVDLLDDALRRAAEAEDEPPEQNFVRKHYLELKESEGSEGASSRIFSNAAGEFGSLVNERVSAGSWEETEELGETWAQRNAFAFGRGQRGVERRKVLDSLLATSGTMVQLTDSVEYGLTDIQEYYANTGAMVRKMGDLQGRKVSALIVETTKNEVRPRQLDSALRFEYRTKLLNPKWAEAMVAEGSGGAFEVSQRMTALVGWGATARFQEGWVYDQGVEQYVFDKDMAAKLQANNPEAFRNIVGRFLEANARGMWSPDQEVIDKLQETYEDLGDELELAGM